ncbi:MAG: 6,7-dimethyl-8-ribityllumazine synthase [Bacteroidetes bacterium]|nr:MAG: 6,7-dimethyl-8-ribityllumazine synthase [Bacteroidota bacterium]
MAEISNSNLYKLNAGILSKDAFIVIIRTEWNAAIVDKLEEGCIKVFNEHAIRHETITVPGVFEIPFGTKNYWDAQKYRDERPAAFIALGCVVRGDTPHFDYVCKAVTEGVLMLNLSLPVPTIFGILTVDNDQQAQERIGGKHGHKGEEAAITALKMIALKKSFSNHK